MIYIFTYLDLIYSCSLYLRRTFTDVWPCPCADFKGMVGRLVNMTNVNVDMLKVDSMSWRDQFRNAMNVNGGDIESATNIDYLMHFLTFGWKVGRMY